MLGWLNSINGGMSDGCELGTLDDRELGPLDGRELSQTDNNLLGVEHGCNDGLELGTMLGWVEGTPDVTRRVARRGRRLATAVSWVRKKAGPDGVDDGADECRNEG